MSKDSKKEKLDRLADAATRSGEDTPQEIEQALLAGLMGDPAALDKIREILEADDFAFPEHRVIYGSMISTPGGADRAILSSRLAKAGMMEKAGGADYLKELADADCTPSRLEDYAEMIKTAAQAQEAQNTIREILGDIKKAPALPAALDRAEEKIREQRRKLDLAGEDIPSMRKMLAGILEEIFDTPYKPIRTFSEGINRNLGGGLMRGEVFTITGRAGGGKTTLALQLMEEIARRNKILKEAEEPLNICLYIHLEQGHRQLMVKTLSRLGQINSLRFRARTVKPEDIDPARKIYLEEIAPYFYTLSAPWGVTLGDIKSIINRVANKITDPHQLIVCVDPFQDILTGDPMLDKDTLRQVGAVASGFKVLARDMDLALILLSDTTKGAVKDMLAKTKPDGTATRGSYQIEHRTDISAVIHTYDDEDEDKLPVWWERRKHHKAIVDYFKEAQADRTPYEEDPEAGVYAELLFSKVRDGASIPVPFYYKKAYHQFIPAEEVGNYTGI